MVDRAVADAEIAGNATGDHATLPLGPVAGAGTGDFLESYAGTLQLDNWVIELLDLADRRLRGPQLHVKTLRLPFEHHSGIRRLNAGTAVAKCSGMTAKDQ